MMTLSANEKQEQGVRFAAAQTPLANVSVAVPAPHPLSPSAGVTLVCAAPMCTALLTGHFSAALKSSEN
jgi:hypothetical protein